MAPQDKAAKASDPDESASAGEKLEPIGVVKRELTRPDGSKVVVEVPVYPPFRLAEPGTARRPAPRQRSVPSVKGKRGRPKG